MNPITIIDWNDSLDEIRDRWDSAIRKPAEVSMALDTYGDLPVEIDERDDKFVIEMAMPKFRREEIEVSRREGFVRVRATRPRSAVTDDVSAGSETVERTFRLPKTVDMGSLVSRFGDGVLTIDVLKFAPR